MSSTYAETLCKRVLLVQSSECVPAVTDHGCCPRSAWVESHWSSSHWTMLIWALQYGNYAHPFRNPGSLKPRTVKAEQRFIGFDPSASEAPMFRPSFIPMSFLFCRSDNKRQHWPHQTPFSVDFRCFFNNRLAKSFGALIYYWWHLWFEKGSSASILRRLYTGADRRPAAGGIF